MNKKIMINKYNSMCNVIDDYQDKELSKTWKKIEGNYRFI